MISFVSGGTGFLCTVRPIPFKIAQKLNFAIGPPAATLTDKSKLAPNTGL